MKLVRKLQIAISCGFLDARQRVMARNQTMKKLVSRKNISRNCSILLSITGKDVTCGHISTQIINKSPNLDFLIKSIKTKFAIYLRHIRRLIKFIISWIGKNSTDNFLPKIQNL